MRFLSGCILFSLLLPMVLSAQVSHPSGYYKDVDSLFFEVQWELAPNEKLQVAVNQFTEDGFQDYKGGFYLKDRSYSENTWENIHQHNQSGKVSIQYHGQDERDGDVSVVGENKMNNGREITKLRLEVVENSKEGDYFNVYVRNNNENLLLIKEAIRPTYKQQEAPFIMDSGDGWSIIWHKRTGYKVGDYWDVIINPQYNTHYPVDYSVNRGALRKVNTIRVRTVDETNTVVRDSVYIVGFGFFPYEHPIFFATADSLDVNEVMTNYSGFKVKKNVHLNILAPNGESLFSGRVMWNRAGMSSRLLPNSSVSFKAVKKSYKNGFGNTLFKDKDLIARKIKFRTGSSGMYSSFSVHEIFLRIIQNSQLRLLGGIDNTIATWYLNGSYWSLGFIQEKPNKNFYSNLLNTKRSEIELAVILGLDVIKRNDLSDSKADYLSPDKESHLLTDSNAKNIFSQGIELYSDSVLWNHKFFKLPIDDNYDLILGAMRKGEGKKMLEIMNDILEGVKPIEDILDIDLWCAYLSLIHFGSFNDILNNNNPFGISKTGLLFPIILDFDSFNPFAVESSNSNWDDIFENNNSVSGGLIKLIMQRFKDSDYAMKRLVLVYEDLLNTSLDSDRTIAIVEDMEKEVMKYYTEKYLSWGGEPNGGIPPESQNYLYHKLKSYFRERPDSASLYLADYLLKDEYYQLEDRNQVEVNFDSIPRDVVLFRLNSLNLDSNFSGLYFPKPNLQIEYQVKEGYDIYIKEYPDLGNSFELSANQPIKLTFLTKNED